MRNLHTPILDPVNPQYPFAQWSTKSAHEGKLLRRAEERDTTSRQVIKNTRLAAHPVESGIETSSVAWQPQDPTHAQPEEFDASMAGSETTNPKSVDGRLLGTSELASELSEPKTLLQEPDEHFVPVLPKFTETESAMLGKWVPRRFDRPTLFPLLFEIATLQVSGQNKQPATTERLMAKSTLDPLEIKADVFRVRRPLETKPIVCNAQVTIDNIFYR